MNKSDILLIVSTVLIGTAAVATSAAPRGERAAISFTEMDINSDGLLTLEDLTAMRDARFAELDANGDGAVSRDEFAAHAINEAQARGLRRFDQLDVDGDGMLSPDAFEARQRSPGPRLIERFDANGDGGLSEDEFDAARERMAEMRGRWQGQRHGE